MSDTKIIADREAELYEAMIAFDYPVLDAILSDEVSYIHSTAVVETKADYFAGLRSGLYEYGAIDIRSGSTRMFEGIAMTTGVMDMLVGANGSTKGMIRLQHVLVWRLEAGTWRLLLRQATRIPA
ncbi:MAG TPA: nuclear transport factor 2 family protein [Acetobacteraceae bacterium]|nr:nuclear transport factor 2 family protein [Acetobacteraceae bacterium]